MNEWDELADYWEADSGPREYAGAAHGSLADLMQQRQLSFDGTRVLDFGCGTGLLTELLVAHGCAVDAMDTSPGMLAVVENKIEQRDWGNVRALAHVPKRAADYDLVVCSSVCSFLDDYPQTVTELARLLRPGGLFVQWDWEADPADADSHGLTRNEISGALVAAGLGDVVVAAAFEITIEGQLARPLMGAGTKV